MPRSGGTVAWGALAGTAVLCAVFGWRPLFSPDLGFYLSYGRSIVEAGWVPYVDSLTFTRTGSPLGLTPWLFSLVSWWGFRDAGPDTLIVVKILLHLAVLCGLVVLAARRVGSLSAYSGLLACLFVLGSLHEYRPHLFSWLVWFVQNPHWKWVHRDASHSVFVHRTLPVDLPEVRPGERPSLSAAITSPWSNYERLSPGCGRGDGM